MGSRGNMGGLLQREWHDGSWPWWLELADARNVVRPTGRPNRSKSGRTVCHSRGFPSSGARTIFLFIASKILLITLRRLKGRYWDVNERSPALLKTGYMLDTFYSLGKDVSFRQRLNSFAKIRDNYMKKYTFYIYNFDLDKHVLVNNIFCFEHPECCI